MREAAKVGVQVSVRPPIALKFAFAAKEVIGSSELLAFTV
jgi:hypothetical protein